MRIVLALALCLVAAPVLAQDPPAPPAEEDDGFSLMEEGMRLVMRGVMQEMEPALDEMGKALDQLEPQFKELAPKLKELIAMIDDIRNYDAPVILPNGDILIRRTAPLPPETDPEVDPGADPQPGPNGEIEL